MIPHTALLNVNALHVLKYMKCINISIGVWYTRCVFDRSPQRALEPAGSLTAGAECKNGYLSYLE